MSGEKKIEIRNEAFARTLKRMREESGLSMNRLAEAAGLSQPMIGLFERGIHSPTVETLFRLARALKTNAATLLAEVDKDIVPVKSSPAKAVKKTVVKKRPKPL